MTKKHCILATILVVFVAIGLIACGDSNSSPSSPSASFEPAPMPNVGSSSGGSSSGGATSGGNSGGNDAPKCDFSITRKDISITQDGDSTWVNGIVPGKEASSGRTLVYLWFPRVNDGDQKGPFELNKPFRIDLGDYGTYNGQVAVEMDLNGDDKADNGCQDDRHHFTVVLTPPDTPKGCPDNDTSFLNISEGDGQFCFNIAWGTNQPGPYSVNENGEPQVQGEKSGNMLRCYEQASEPQHFDWNFEAGKCDPQDGIDIPGDVCLDQPDLGLECRIHDGKLQCRVNSGTAGVAKIGNQTLGQFGPGETVLEHELPENACGRAITVTAKNRCGQEEEESVELPDCPKCEDLNPPNWSDFSFNAPLEEVKNCKNVSPLCNIGGAGNSCHVNDQDRCVGNFSGHDYGPANVEYDRDNPIIGSITVFNGGNWRLEMRASKNGEDYHKAQDPAELVCEPNGSQATLNVSYNWANHGSRYWYLELYRNNVLVATSDVVDGH